MIDWIHLALRPQFHLGWNLFLALVPLALACWIFRRTPRRGWLWWPLLVVFIIFLPNAAYVLTDIIHFIDEVRYSEPQLPEWSVAYVVIPKYVLFIFVGFQSHVISLILMGDYMRWIHRKHWVIPAEFGLNFLCSVGVFWGRYLRLNSWDIVTKPQRLGHRAIESLVANNFGIVMILRYFIIITALYYVLKVIDLAVWEYIRQRRLKHVFVPEPTQHPVEHMAMPPVE
jgi:uncharacterized membrane protein